MSSLSILTGHLVRRGDSTSIKLDGLLPVWPLEKKLHSTTVLRSYFMRTYPTFIRRTQTWPSDLPTVHPPGNGVVASRESVKILSSLIRKQDSNRLLLFAQLCTVTPRFTSLFQKGKISPGLGSMQTSTPRISFLDDCVLPRNQILSTYRKSWLIKLI